MNKKTFILTHPLTGNYGGLLQAYANYTILDKLGCNPYIYQYKPNDFPLDCRALFQYFKQHIKYLLGRSNQAHTVWQKLRIAKKFLKGLRIFKETHPAPNDRNISYVVGSDQVWRALFCRKMKSPEFYFLNFATSEQRHNSIAYAASMGVDAWEGTEEETEACKKLIQEFKAVSVREHSGVIICREIFGKHAEQMPDPTFLLSNEEYNQLINRKKTWTPSTPFLASYILDENIIIRQNLMEYSQSLQISLQHLLPHANASQIRDRFSHSVEQWLRLIRDAKYFITDSFHGCVFAIIFNKPFVCLGNKNRGSARFDSLLATFGLQDRLAINPTAEQILQILNTPIDWAKVNSIRIAEQERALEFLRTNLGRD